QMDVVYYNIAEGTQLVALAGPDEVNGDGEEYWIMANVADERRSPAGQFSVSLRIRRPARNIVGQIGKVSNDFSCAEILGCQRRGIRDNQAMPSQQPNIEGYTPLTELVRYSPQNETSM
ncbi:hypothetical protein, partial [Streptomyces cadmiisoli]|uniref:hypothetical protein n=1 Tax=Streptomyces cadmiisoli TaxID=2184053 RepID=UPI003655E700